MPSEINLTVWTDAPEDRALAGRLAAEAAQSVFRSSGQRAEVVSFSSAHLEPGDIDALAGMEPAEPAPDLPRWAPKDADWIVEYGSPAIKLANPVYLVQTDAAGSDFVVETNEGPLTARAGDYIAHDPISGHVWPVAASYVEQHYDFAPAIPESIADEVPSAEERVQGLMDALVQNVEEAKNVSSHGSAEAEVERALHEGTGRSES